MGAPRSSPEAANNCPGGGLKDAAAFEAEPAVAKFDRTWTTGAVALVAPGWPSIIRDGPILVWEARCSRRGLSDSQRLCLVLLRPHGPDLAVGLGGRLHLDSCWSHCSALDQKPYYAIAKGVSA